MILNRRQFLHTVIAALGLLAAGQPAFAQGAPKHVIFFIADGMGPEQVRAARMFHGGRLAFETLPQVGLVTTYAANAPVTDSAASATAYATGHKVNNGVLSIALPGDGRPLPTLLELFKAQGKAVGLVTDDELTQATPAAFGAHVASRKLTQEIARWYLTVTQPNLLVGGGDPWITPNWVSQAGYKVFTNTRGMKQALAEYLRSSPDEPLMLSGVFGESRYPYYYLDQTAATKEYGENGYPRLSEMTEFALAALSRDPDGFFVMIEGAHVDKSGHKQLLTDENRTGAMVYAAIEFSRAVDVALRWSAARSDTLIVVTSDHETGGLKIVADRGVGKLPDVTWAHTSHTGADVDLWAKGPGAEQFARLLDNTDVFKIIVELCKLPADQRVPARAASE